MDIKLRAFEKTDINYLMKWRNNENYAATTSYQFFISSKRMENDIDKWMEDDSKNLYLVIDDIKTDTPIGFISLINIDMRSRRAEWGGILLDDSSNRSRGFASQASILLFNYAFYELNLNKITGYWIKSNKVSVFLGKLLGFKEEGLLKAHIYKNNAYHDVIIMSLFRDAFKDKAF
jgi:RimJ/RimL family protein N-acetyltransferase